MPLMDDSDTKYKTVDYEKLTAVLIEGMKEQQQQIDELKAILTTDKKRIILENSEAEDIKITNFSAPNSTTATVLDQYYRNTASSISLSSASVSNSAVFTGAIKLSSSVDFAASMLSMALNASSFISAIAVFLRT